MKILIHGINFSPELTGIGKYTGEMAEWLAAHGHEVRVVTAPPYYPAWRVLDGYRNGWTAKVVDGNPGGFVVYRCPLWVPARPGGIMRLLHLASFALSSLPVMLRHIFWRPDVVWVVEPALLCAPAASLVAWLCGARAWLHVQDLEVDIAFDLGLLGGDRVRRMVLAAERWVMRRFDVVSTISQRMLQHLHSKGLSPGHTALLPNWVDVAAITPRPASAGHSPLRAALGIAEDAVVALYSGNMGAKQGLDVLADAARMCLSHEKSGTGTVVGSVPATIVFVFCGDGAERADLQARCADLANVRFLDLQPVQSLNDLLTMADIHLLPQRADAADWVMPSKLTGMLASGRPVVATAQPGTELARVVQDCGTVVPPADSQAIVQAILALAADAALRTRLGAAGRSYAEQHLDRQAVLARFEAALLALHMRRQCGRAV